jgi:hypothetical protein
LTPPEVAVAPRNFITMDEADELVGPELGRLVKLLARVELVGSHGRPMQAGGGRRSSNEYRRGVPCVGAQMNAIERLEPPPGWLATPQRSGAEKPGTEYSRATCRERRGGRC